MTETWTVRKVLAWTAQHFEKRNIDSPRLTAEVLLAHILEVDRVRLYVDFDRPLEPAELKSFKELIQKRSDGAPTQYLTGTREFYARAFRVDPRVLIPRPETELLVEAVLRHLPKDVAARALDLCTGSGCIGVTLAAERPLCQVIATDSSTAACEVARANAEAHGVLARVQVMQGDLFAGAQGPFDVVVSNPPYVRTDDIATLSTEVRQEPRLALDGGVDGLDVLRRIVAGAMDLLVPGGLLALELGDMQGPAVLALLIEAGWADARIEKDLARHDRLAFASRPTQQRMDG